MRSWLLFFVLIPLLLAGCAQQAAPSPSLVAPPAQPNVTIGDAQGAANLPAPNITTNATPPPAVTPPATPPSAQEWHPDANTDCNEPEVRVLCEQFCIEHPSECAEICQKYPNACHRQGGEAPVEPGVVADSAACSTPAQMISGPWADAEIVKLSDGSYRMYYNCGSEACSPESSGIVSAVSSDGKTWAQEAGSRLKYVRQPGIVKMDGGILRMYYTDADGMGISLATTSDGISFASGTQVLRAGGSEDGAGISAPSVIKTTGGYRMYYVGAKSDDTQSILSAVSTDGLSWTKENGRRIDATKPPFFGKLDGPYAVETGGGVELYFWNFPPPMGDRSQRNPKVGVQRAFSSDGLAFGEPEFLFGSDDFNKVPSDPAVMRDGEKWAVYYGVYGEGLFRKDCD